MHLGSHLSIAGGLEKALHQAAELGFNTVALFVRNQVQWKAPPLTDETVRRFKHTRQQTGISPVVAHASYLVNLAGNEPVRSKSIAAMVEDVTRCQRLGIEYLVLHPGSSPDLDEGITRIAAGLDSILGSVGRGDTRILLETTAGQGNCIGHRFEHLAAIRRKTKRRARIGICLDTAHIFAAGYALAPAATYRETMNAFDDIIGLKHLHAIHLNDSKREFGSRVDRHEHIGKGTLGRDAFKHLVCDPRLSDVPMILETPKGKDGRGQDMDTVNARLLQRLAGDIT